MAHLSEPRQLRQEPRPQTRCRRRQAERYKERTAGHCRNGFLNHCFLPFYDLDGRQQRTDEEEFFGSLDRLCDHYQLEHPDVSAFAYPQNITEAHRTVAASLADIDKEANVIIARDESHSASLTVLHTYDTGNILYYIPVRPLWNLVKTANAAPMTDLLLSVYAYLYQAAGIPFYAMPGTYLYDEYDMLLQWVLEADDDDEEQKAIQEEQVEEMDLLLGAGSDLLVLLQQPERLQNFEAHIVAYRNCPEWHAEMEGIATDCLFLYQNFPNRSIMDNIKPDLLGDDDDYTIRAGNYISFYWSGYDGFYDMLLEMVNNEFQESSHKDEPMLVQVFDGSEVTAPASLDYEKALFALLDRICLFFHDHQKQYDYSEAA